MKVSKARIMVSDKMQSRHYRPRAYLSTTGAVLRITCGCRTWRSLTEAVAHYAGGGPYRQKRWRDIDGAYEGYGMGNDSNIRARNDALLTLARLAVKIDRAQKRIRNR